MGSLKIANVLALLCSSKKYAASKYWLVARTSARFDVTTFLALQSASPLLYEGSQFIKVPVDDLSTYYFFRG
jgi:hypothetical protein